MGFAVTSTILGSWDIMIYTHMKTHDRSVVVLVLLTKSDVEIGVAARTYAISALAILPGLSWAPFDTIYAVQELNDDSLPCIFPKFIIFHHQVNPFFIKAGEVEEVITALVVDGNDVSSAQTGQVEAVAKAQIARDAGESFQMVSASDRLEMDVHTSLAIGNPLGHFTTWPKSTFHHVTQYVHLKSRDDKANNRKNDHSMELMVIVFACVWITIS